MGTRRIVCTIASLVLLVLVLGVAGASADGVMGGHRHANLVSFDAIHNLSGAAAWHNDFAFGGNTQFKLAGSSYWLGSGLELFGPTLAIVPVPPNPPSTTPEPGTLYLLLIGGGLLVLGMRRRAIQS
jgi:hypothetical protein